MEADGTPYERDGNPIFDALNRDARLAVQIIQWPPQSDDVEISGWISELETEWHGEVLPVFELTINLSLSTESAKIAERLLAKWVAGASSVEEMKAILREF